MSKIDLTFGNPSFLFKYWKEQDLPETDFYYPYPYMAEQQSEYLESTIRKVHKDIGNVIDVDSYHIVIGNGATQLLSAIIYETKGISTTAPAPYFCRFPVIAQLGANSWREQVDHYLPKADKAIVSAPNNPDGDWDNYLWQTSKTLKPKHRYGEFNIVDACYNWPQYTNILGLDDDIIIYSLSKATGHAGTRLGWALIKDKQLADNVKRSIEMSTMGVSQMAQQVGAFVLNREAIRMISGKENVFSVGKKELDRRWAILKQLDLPFTILNEKGMFAWCQGEIPSHVEGLPGSMFGDTNKKFRLNIGCSLGDFNSFIEPYLKEEENGKEPTEV